MRDALAPIIARIDASGQYGAFQQAALATVRKLDAAIKVGADNKEVEEALKATEAVMESTWKNTEANYMEGFAKSDGSVFSSSVSNKEGARVIAGGEKAFNGGKPTWVNNEDTNPANVNNKPSGGLWMELRKTMREPLEQMAGRGSRTSAAPAAPLPAASLPLNQDPAQTEGLTPEGKALYQAVTGPRWTTVMEDTTYPWGDVRFQEDCAVSRMAGRPGKWTLVSDHSIRFDAYTLTFDATFHTFTATRTSDGKRVCTGRLKEAAAAPGQTPR